MKAIGYVVTNQQAINDAERLNLPNKPDPITQEKEILLPVSLILLAYVHEGRIMTITSLGREISFKYEETVWQRIKAHLEHV